MRAIIYSKDMCGYCVQAKNLLNIKNVEYEEKNITLTPEYREELLEAVPNARSLPQVFLNEQYIGGFTELKEYFEKGNFNDD